MEYFHTQRDYNTTQLIVELFHYGFIDKMELTQDRVRALVNMLGQRAIAEATGIKEERLKTIRYKKDANVRTNELDMIAQAFQQYALWLRTGEIDVSKGQISPAYAEADLKLDGQNAGSN